MKYQDVGMWKRFLKLKSSSCNIIFARVEASEGESEIEFLEEFVEEFWFATIVVVSSSPLEPRFRRKENRKPTLQVEVNGGSEIQVNKAFLRTEMKLVGKSRG